MIPPLQLNLFGSPQIIYQGQPLNGFVSAKVRALLIYLAVTARPHSRDHLAELLWADTPASTRVNLRKALSNLRQLIGNILVEDAKESIALDPQQVRVDVLEFGRLVKQAFEEQATELYHADFLSGFNLSLSYEFESWALSEQSRLKSQMVDLLRNLATQHTSATLSAGETRNTLNQAIQSVRRLLQLEPWHEENHRWLMELLAKDGQRSAALAHFEVCKRVLQEELAVQPSAETLALVEKIQHTTLPQAKAAARISPSIVPEFPLIGRENEWQTIQAAWHRSQNHGIHFIAIAGEAGIGKTRLTEEARNWVAHQGYASVYARSYAAEGALAYSPVVDWVRSEVIKSTLAQLDKVWLGEIARLLPELLIAQPTLPPPKPISDGVQRRVFFEALARAITASGQPMLLVIDDLQWCDRETLEWLRFLLRFDPNYPLLLIGAYRVEEVEPDHALFELLVSLRQSAQVTEFEIRMLSASETERLVQVVAAQKVVDDELLSLFQETSGHPLFVIESLRNGKGKSSDVLTAKASVQTANTASKVQNVIQARLSRLSVETRELVDLAATIGRSFSLPLLKQASQRDEILLLRQLDELWQRRIIVEKESAQFDLSHDRIRETVYMLIRPLRRQQLHQQVAEALEKFYADGSPEWNAQIAVHYQNAGKPTNALPYYVSAVQTSVSRWALREALGLIEQALASIEQQPENRVFLSGRLKLRIIQYEVVTRLHGYMSPQLRQIVTEISQLSEALQDRSGYYMAQNKLRLYYSLRAEWFQAKTIAEANIVLAEATENPDAISEAHLVLGRVNFYMGDLVYAKSRYDRANSTIDMLDPHMIRFDSGQPQHVNAYTNTAHNYWVN